VIELHQRAPLALEADRIAPGEELQRPGKPRAEPARAPGDDREPPVLPGVERDEPIVLPQIPGLEDDPFGPEKRH
jgi:hypothetical protein